MFDSKEKMDKLFAENLKWRMAEKGLSFRGLAKATGIPHSSLNDYYHARVSVPLNAAKTLAVYFGVEVDQMLEERIRRIK